MVTVGALSDHIMRADEAAFNSIFSHLLAVGDMRLRRRLWRSFCRDEKASLQRYVLREFWSPHGGGWGIQELMDTHLTPHELVGFLERSVVRGYLTRAEANLIEEQVLKRTGPSGGWKWPKPRQTA